MYWLIDCIDATLALRLWLTDVALTAAEIDGSAAALCGQSQWMQVDSENKTNIDKCASMEVLKTVAPLILLSAICPGPQHLKTLACKLVRAAFT